MNDQWENWDTRPNNVVNMLSPSRDFDSWAPPTSASYQKKMTVGEIIDAATVAGYATSRMAVTSHNDRYPVCFKVEYNDR